MTRPALVLAPFAAISLWLAATGGVGAPPEPATTVWDDDSAGPQIVIDGPTSAPAGTLVVLDASGTQADRLAWCLAEGPSDCWRATDNGRTVSLAFPSARRLVFVLAASNAAGLSIQRHTIDLEGVDPGPQPDPPGPGPAPNPQPAPQPNPPLPPCRFGLPAFSWGLVSGLPSSDATLIDAIASNYENAARRAAAGDTAYRTPDQIRAATLAANRATLGTSRERLLPIVFQPLAEQLAKLESSGGLVGTGDIADAWREIALGFRTWSKSQGGR